MLGAIIGDIVGSVYEWNNVKTKDFPLFRKDCFFTDDTVMTVATADAVLKGGARDDFIDAYKSWGRAYPGRGYGGRFAHWLASDSRAPYNSYGNGSAMRASPCGWMMCCRAADRMGLWPSGGRELARFSAEATHDHPEGVKGALAVTDAIFICRYHTGGFGLEDGEEPRTMDFIKRSVREHLETEYGYDLSKTLDEIRPGYRFDETCQGTVPQAMTAFLESAGFEDAIRNAISLGGDSDTLAAVTGGVAEAAWGIPPEIREKALSYLDAPMLDVLRRWEAFLDERHDRIGSC